MANVIEFEEWLYRMIKDGKERLDMRDCDIAHVLLRNGLAYYNKAILNRNAKG